LRSTVGREVAARIRPDDVVVHAPHLLEVEVVHVLRRLVRLGELTADRARLSVELLARLPLRRRWHTPLLGRMWHHRHNLTAYDACYVSLAESLDATLLTCDPKLRDAPGHAARVDVLEMGTS
jgi:predicted nucleic acid-binding protein